jgi:hypothetical protein
MRFARLNVLTFFLIIVLFDGCYDRYAAPSVTGSSNYLVVSGFLNAGDGSCSIILSHSLLLSDPDAPASVSDASVFIEDENGNSSALPSQGYGVYSNKDISLNFQLTYRLRIMTSDGKSYFSDYVPILQSPAIDTVSWSLDQQGSAEPNINIFVSSKGSKDQSPYYFWSFTETWRHHAAFLSDLKYVNGQIVPAYDSNYYCWQSLNSASILISSTKQLSQNIVNQFAINSFPVNSVRLYDGYSILVTQLSLTQAAFEYWQQLKATTENLGTIFGPLPSQFSGNIHSVTNPSEPVFGYFSASVVSEKRIFIKPWDFYFPTVVTTGYEGCTMVKLPLKDLDKLGSNVIVSSYGLGPEGYYVSSIDCVDCRLKGGTNVKPIFWYE